MTYKKLCAELTEALTTHAKQSDGAVGYVAGLLTRARAALSDPTDEQLLTTYARALTEVVGDAPKPWPDDLVNKAQLAGIRAVLNRYGNQTP